MSDLVYTLYIAVPRLFVDRILRSEQRANGKYKDHLVGQLTSDVDDDEAEGGQFGHLPFEWTCPAWECGRPVGILFFADPTSGSHNFLMMLILIVANHENNAHVRIARCSSSTASL